MAPAITIDCLYSSKLDNVFDVNALLYFVPPPPTSKQQLQRECECECQCKSLAPQNKQTKKHETGTTWCSAREWRRIYDGRTTKIAYKMQFKLRARSRCHSRHSIQLDLSCRTRCSCSTGVYSTRPTPRSSATKIRHRIAANEDEMVERRATDVIRRLLPAVFMISHTIRRCRDGDGDDRWKWNMNCDDLPFSM